MKSFAIKEASVVSDGRLVLIFVPYNIPPQLTDFEVNLEASTLALTFSKMGILNSV